MAKVDIYRDERWPDYAVFEEDDGEYEVDEETLARWRRVEKKYGDIQREIEKVYKKEE